MLSYGGRLTLIKYCVACWSLFKPSCFWGADVQERKISWVKWDLILNCKEKGGLRVGSLDALNNALIYKWKWRYCTNTNALWTRVIRVCNDKQFGLNGKLHSTSKVDKGNMIRKLGDGCLIQFWRDKWRDQLRFKMKYDQWRI
uniref:Reverse transcriptase zinc-binding domain-containing protein n=1 Tax=Lactuca sativa TaxID=4236 RepID=A0A9R1VN85_LACSA|nr:hypothetical protein LSAT_V11C400225470 [Lactuca sativa]